MCTAFLCVLGCIGPTETWSLCRISEDKEYGARRFQRSCRTPDPSKRKVERYADVISTERSPVGSHMEAKQRVWISAGFATSILSVFGPSNGHGYLGSKDTCLVH